MLLLLSLLLAACDRNEASYRPGFSDQSAEKAIKKPYIFGVHPLHNPERLLERYGPVMDYINRHIEGVEFAVEASRNYDEFNKKLYNRHFDFALPNPYQTVNSLKHGYRVFGKMGDDKNFTGILLVRRDSGIREVTDLKGKKVSYPANTAVAAYMMPQYYLQTHGIDVNKDIENLFVGSQESSIMNVYLGNVAVGVTWPIPWLAFQKEQPNKAAQLEVRWKTEPLVNNGLVARDDMPPELVRRVAGLLEHLHESAEGRTMLGKLPISRFELADDATFDVARVFFEKFSKAVRPLD
jgi:phosphonate transport system substrate-binding protein